MLYKNSSTSNAGHNQILRKTVGWLYGYYARFCSKHMESPPKISDEIKLKQLFKEALIETLEERKYIFHDLITETIEDVALSITSAGPTPACDPDLPAWQDGGL